MDWLEHLGVKEGKVALSEFRPEWAGMYQAESIRLQQSCAAHLQEIQHIGSTAIPGIAAKPIIDIMLGSHSASDSESCVPIITGLGYDYKGEYGIPGRLFFVGRQGEYSCFHLHLVERSSEFWQTHILFRDFLLAHPDRAQAYEQLKQELSLQYRDNRDAYTAAKHDFIQAVLRDAGHQAG